MRWLRSIVTKLKCGLPCPSCGGALKRGPGGGQSEIVFCLYCGAVFFYKTPPPEFQRFERIL